MRRWFWALEAALWLSACQTDEDTAPPEQRDRAAIGEPGFTAGQVEQGPAGVPSSVGPSSAWPAPVRPSDAGAADAGASGRPARGAGGRRGEPRPGAAR